MTCPIYRVKAFLGWTPENNIYVVMMPWDLLPCECGSSVTASFHEQTPVGRRQWSDAWHQCERDLLGSKRVYWEKDPEDLYDSMMRRKTSKVVRGTVRH